MTAEFLRLHAAAQSGDAEMVKELLNEAMPIDAFDDMGKTPLHYAVMNEQFEVARLLIDAGANVNAHDEATISNTPLGEIAGNCSYEMAKLLVNAGADPTIPGWMRLSALDRSSKRQRDDGQKVFELLSSAAKRTSMPVATTKEKRGRRQR